MKQIFAVIGLLSLVSGIIAQAPQKLSYQAVIRNTVSVSPAFDRRQ